MNNQSMDNFRAEIEAKSKAVLQKASEEATQKREMEIERAKKLYSNYIDTTIVEHIRSRAERGYNLFNYTKDGCYFAFDFPVSIDGIYMNDSRIGSDHLCVTNTEIGEFVNAKLNELGFFLTNEANSSSTVRCYAQKK